MYFAVPRGDLPSFCEWSVSEDVCVTLAHCCYGLESYTGSNLPSIERIQESLIAFLDPCPGFRYVLARPTPVHLSLSLSLFLPHVFFFDPIPFHLTSFNHSPIAKSACTIPLFAPAQCAHKVSPFVFLLFWFRALFPLLPSFHPPSQQISSNKPTRQDHKLGE